MPINKVWKINSIVLCDLRKDLVMSKSVIILNYGLHICGVSRVLVNFANMLVSHGYDVTLKIEVNDFALKNELNPCVKCSLFLKEPQIFGHKIRGFLRFYNLFLKSLYKLPLKFQHMLVVGKKYDIEMAFNRGAAARIISGSTNKTSRKLVWVHSDYMRNNNPLAGFSDLEDAKAGYCKFDKIICVSEQAQKSFAQKFGDGYPLITLYNIMDVDGIRKNAQKETLKNDIFTVVAVGRLFEAKNYELLMDTIEILNRRGHKLCCQIIGSGELFNGLVEIKNEKKLDNVFFLGEKSNPYTYMNSADLYVSSSVYEGLSTTTIEALILGKPCVVTDCAGMKTILGSNNEYGVVVPIEAEALANAIERMITDRYYYNWYQLKATERAKFFDTEVAFKKIEELF